MAAVTVNVNRVAPVFARDAEIYSFIAGEAIEYGDPVYINSSGKVVKGDAGAVGTAKFAGYALLKAGTGAAVDVLVRGAMAGHDLSGLDYGDPVYLADGGGTADAAGSTEVVTGAVMPISDYALTKVLYVNANLVTQA